MGQISDSLLFIIIIQRFICLKAREGEKQRERVGERQEDSPSYRFTHQMAVTAGLEPGPS